MFNSSICVFKKGKNSENVSISNDASTSGQDIETLNSAYKNYKKLIGTYDTLVSRRDYENAIYNLNYSLDSPVISNDIVADRTTDLTNPKHRGGHRGC